MINSINTTGHIVKLNITDPLHYDGQPQLKRKGDDVSGSFADVLNNSIKKVNDLQVDSEQAMQKMIYQPDSIDIHQVMIANQKAEISLAFTRSIRDGAMNAYRELMNLR